MSSQMKQWLKLNILWLILLAIIILSFGTGFLLGILVFSDSVETTYTEIYKPVVVSEKSEKSEKYEEIEWETFTATAYCPCKKCCGKTDGITASGVLAEEGRTVAADWSILPAGIIIEIEGIGKRVVEDKGGAIKGKRLDIYFDSHKDALDFGVREVLIRIVNQR